MAAVTSRANKPSISSPVCVTRTRCSPYFIALQYINNLETERSYKKKVNLKNLKFFKKSIERFKNYSLIC